MSTLDGTLRITYNGEIYNFRELRKDLEGRGVRFRTTSDTEVLLELYRSEGPRFLSKLRGMYAFALWDASRKELFLARDPFGIKPLYFADDGRTLRFASQVKALLAGGNIDDSPSAAGQVGFLLWGHVPEPHTIYQGIRSLPPGYAMTISAGGPARIWKHCDVLDLLAEAEQGGTHADDENSISEPIRRAVAETVNYHMVADVPVGCFLSSGIDSNVLCAFASQAVKAGTLKCVTLGFKEYRGTHADEVPLAVQSASTLGVHHQVCEIARQEFIGDIERLLHCMDQPSVDGANTYFVAKAAAAAGLKVAISGVGADEIFGGYPSFSQVPRLASVSRWLPQGSAMGAVFRRLTAPLLRRITSPKYASLLEYGGSLAGAYFLRRGLYMPWEISGLLEREVVRQGLGELNVPTALGGRLLRFGTPYVSVMAAEIVEYLQPRLLRDTDWAGMAHSLEIRTPYVDVHFLRQITRLMSRLRVPPSKRDLATASPVPLLSSLLERRKSGFSVPTNAWLQVGSNGSRQNSGLRNWAKIVAARFRLELTNEARRSVSAHPGASPDAIRKP
jgi:asparagine synthase (glutamine-hydrolysing)